MVAKQYRPIILKVVKDGKKFGSPEEFVNHLISKMEDFEEMFSLACESLGNGTTAPTPTKEYSPLIIGPSEAGPATPSRREEDASARFGAKPTASGNMFDERFSKQEVFDYYQRELPKRIEVKPPLCTGPITLEKRITKSPGDDQSEMRKGGSYMTDIRIAYFPVGGNPDEAIVERAYTTDTSLDADSMLARIIKQAEASFRSTQNRVPPRFAQPPPGSLDETISQAFATAETDKNVDPTDLRAWGAPSAPEAAKHYGGEPKIANLTELLQPLTMEDGKLSFLTSRALSLYAPPWLSTREWPLSRLSPNHWMSRTPHH